MEDPYFDMDGGIEEYAAKESSGKVRWILTKGLTLGKKMLVTGLVISSAPLVLPPLVIMSFFGLACSVPYGLFLASYACTDKLMSELLPGSKPPPFLLEFGKVPSTDEEVENDEYGEGELGKDLNEIVEENGYEQDVGEYGYETGEVREEEVRLKQDIDMEKEEDEISEDTREMVEMRIELVEKGNDEVDEEHGRVENDVQELVRYSNEIVKESGYEEDVGEYKDEKELEPMKIEVEVIIEGVGGEEETEPVMQESWDQMPVEGLQAIAVDIKGDEKIGGTAEGTVAPFEVTNIDVELCQSAEIKEDEELVKETKGLLEKIKEDGMTDNEEKDDKQSAEEGNQKVNRNVEEVRMSFEDRTGNDRIEKHLGEVENKTDEIPIEKSREQETGSADNADVTPKGRSSEEMLGGLLEKKLITSNIPEAEKPIIQIEATKAGNDRKVEQVPGLNKPSALQARGRATDNITNNVQKNNQLNREKENVIFSNADAREISDESGFDLFDEKDAASHQFSGAENNSAQGNEQSSSYMRPDVDFTALPAFAGEPKSHEAGISSKEDVGMASSKALYSEEKIWEQIDAMRRIVGYKAASKATSIEEVKALYVFTGVEPPTMFKEPSDLEEVNHKLRFLMSIVGVK